MQNNNNMQTATTTTTPPEPLYTATQERWGQALPPLTGLVSIAGSLLILITLSRDKKSRDNLSPTFCRIMMGLSVMDIVFSASCVLGPWLLPCHVHGFVATYVLGAMSYAAFLALYHCLAVVFEFQESFIAKRIEPVMHVLAICLPTQTAIAGVALGLVEELDILPGQCWIVEPSVQEDHHHDEDNNNNDDEDLHPYVHVAFYSLVLWIFVTSTIVLICMILIFYTVRKNELALRRRYYAGSGRTADTTRRVGWTALRYVAVFVVTYLPVMLILYAEEPQTADSRNFYFWRMILTCLTLPSQGFWNAVIFFYNRWDLVTQPGRALSWLGWLNTPACCCCPSWKGFVFFSKSKSQGDHDTTNRKDSLQLENAKTDKGNMISDDMKTTDRTSSFRTGSFRQVLNEENVGNFRVSIKVLKDGESLGLPNSCVDETSEIVDLDELGVNNLSRNDDEVDDIVGPSCNENDENHLDA